MHANPINQLSRLKSVILMSGESSGKHFAPLASDGLMIRTTLSFCALFGSLLLVSKWLQESSHPQAEPLPAATTQTTSPEARIATPLAPDSAANTHAAILAPVALSGWQFGADPGCEIRVGACGVEPSEIQLVKFDEEEESNASIFAREFGPQPQAARSITADDPDYGLETGEYFASPADEADEDPESAASATPADEELSPRLVDLRKRLRECLAHYYFRPENTSSRSPWGAMHAMIAYGVDSQLIADGRRVNAIGYLNYNGVCKGQNLFYISGGKLQARIGPGVQGHPGQYLAMLAQSRVKSDFPIHVDGREFTVADLIEHEQLTCRPNTELTFKLIALVHYLKSDEQWISNDGQKWNIPRLIQEELKQPIVGAACGGTHRMTGFSYAVRKREQRKEPFTGQWLRAKKFVDDYHEYAFRLQNPDASFSTDWFAGRADFGPASRRLETTGHITEWLAFSLSKEQLVEQRMVRSVSYLTDLLMVNRNEKFGIGPLGHGLHALAIYDERVFGGTPGQRQAELAEIRKKQMAR